MRAAQDLEQIGQIGPALIGIRAVPGDLFQIMPGAEDRTGAVDHDHPDLRVVLRRRNGGVQRSDHRAGQGMGLAATQGEGQHAVCAGTRYILAHKASVP
ncbi:hypothetical protein OKA06_18580 [Novosphingobium sp. MW5]|nr:hypothetical protein [Novosphingobium sp. MW5]